MLKIKKEKAPEIKEELIPMTEEQLQETVDKLTQIYALVYGWVPKETLKGANRNGEKKEGRITKGYF